MCTWLKTPAATLHKPGEACMYAWVAWVISTHTCAAAAAEEGHCLRMDCQNISTFHRMKHTCCVAMHSGAIRWPSSLPCHSMCSWAAIMFQR